MDYNGNDFQGQNLHLADEGNSKNSPVLHPYAPPKFDFDDSLQGHLRFDSLVENEVFLGIPSQEDNQWIEDFSRGNSGIEFNSGAAESCSISRCNNVWSEATSSESVEMLLKSVGQEEMVREETIVEESDACGELGSLTKQKEPNLDQHESVHPISGLNESAESGCPVESTSQTQMAKLSGHGRSRELDLIIVSEESGLIGTRRNMVIDGKCSDSHTIVDISINESLNNVMQKFPSIRGIHTDEISSLDTVVSVGDLNNQEILKQVDGTIAENSNGVQNDVIEEVKAHHVLSEEVVMDNKNLKGTTAEATIHNSKSSFASTVEPVKGHEVETSVNLEKPSNFEAVILPNSTEINQQNEGNTHEESPVVFCGDIDLKGHGVEFFKAGVQANLEIGTPMQVSRGKISSIEQEETFHVSDSQLDSEASMNNSEASLFSEKGDKLPNGQIDGSKNYQVGDVSDFTLASSSTELLGEEHAIENLKGANDASGIQKDLKAEDHVFPSMAAKEISMEIREGDLVSKDGDGSSNRNVSLKAKEVEKLPSYSSVMEYEDVGPLSIDKRFGSSSLVQGIVENDMIDHGSEFDTSSRNEPALFVVLENTNLASDNTLNTVPLLSGTGATSDEGTDYIDEEKSPSLVGVFMHLYNKEETKVEVLTEASLLAPKECAEGASEQGFISGSGKGASHDSTGQLTRESIDQSGEMVETCNAASQSQLLAASSERQDDSSKELEVSLVLSDSKVKDNDNAEVVVIENHEGGTVEKTHEASTSEAEVLVASKDEVLRERNPMSLVESCCSKGQTGYESNEAIAVSGNNDCGQIVRSTAVDTSYDCRDSPNHVPLSESETNGREGGGRTTDSDKANCGSPTVISSIEPYQSEKDRKIGVPVSLNNCVVSEVSDGDVNKVQSTSQNRRENGATRVERSFTFEVSHSAGLAESETSKGFLSFPPIQPCKISPIVEKPPSAVIHTVAKMAPEISLWNPRAAEREKSHDGSKGTTERKRRRVSSKTTGKDSARKGNHVKETTPSGLKACGNIEHNNTKPGGVIPIPTSNLPDLNTSSPSPLSFQQPFTDVQQVQLRAQIFVYGSLIQRITPDEACMISAFGTSAGGRSVWEPAWCAYVERIHGQKSHPNNSETPLQSRSGAGATDQAIKQGPNQSKVISSPVGRGTGKSTPSPVVNSIIPSSSPLWSISSDGLQSGSMARALILDYHQALSPLNPYQRNFVGHNASWLSQAHFPGSWASSQQTSSIYGSAHFPVFPITDSVKLTPIKESYVPISSSTKHVSSSPVVLSGVPSVFAQTSSQGDTMKVTQSIGQHSADPKSRKRKKVPVSVELGQISFLPPTQNQNTEKAVIAEETLSKVEEAKLQAENAVALAAAAVNHSRGVWSELDKQKTSGLASDVEVKLASSAIAVAAAATVAEAAAAAAKIAFDAALQAKLMADESLDPTKSGNYAQTLSKNAKNLDAIVKAAELAAEAVSQAGRIVAMGDPLPLSELVKAGPEGYWKVSQVPSEQCIISSSVNKRQSSVDRVEEGGSFSEKEIQFMRQDHTRMVDGVSGSVTNTEKDLRGRTGLRASELAKTIGVVPESENGTRSASVTVQDEYEKMAGTSEDNRIKEGYLVEVFREDDDTTAAWFLADVLTLKDEKALVCYSKLQSDEGCLKEWVALEIESNKAPRIRIAHPITNTRFKGTRKRRREAMGDYAWSVGDRVDAWIRDSWREGVVMEKNTEDETRLTVRFPAEGETSVVRTWHLRPTLVWKDGEWIEWSNSRGKDRPSQGEMPRDKRLKIGDLAVEGKAKEKMSNNVESVESAKPEESHLLPLLAHEKVFNAGKHTREENKPGALKIVRTGLQKEGSKVIFGIPKPGKKRKFMEVSKHYVAERNNKTKELTDSVKFAKYLMPQVSGSCRWRNNSKIDFNEKRAAESKSKGLKSRKPQAVFGRTTTKKDRLLSSDHMNKDSISIDLKESGPCNPTKFGSESNIEGAEGPVLFSSSKNMSTSNAKSERMNKGKRTAPGEKSAKPKVKDKVYIGNPAKSISEIGEPRRSNRKIQPTSRMLEGLQSSLTISKLPASHDRSHKGQSRK